LGVCGTDNEREGGGKRKEEEKLLVVRRRLHLAFEVL